MTEFVGAILILSAIAEKPLFIVCVCVCSQNKIILLWTVYSVEKQLLINSSLYEWTKTSGQTTDRHFNIIIRWKKM